jgi:arylsulfatase A-like enzyme
MRVHNVEWVAEGASAFIQNRVRGNSNRPFFLYVGWTLPHGPDAERSLREEALAFTPSGMWKTGNSVSLAASRLETRQRRHGITSQHEPPNPNQLGHTDYALALAWLDRGVGTVLWALQKRGIQRDTLVIFTSDHGSGRYQGECRNDATHVPMLIQWPSVLQAGTVVQQAVSLLDVAPTMLHAAIDASNTSLFDESTAWDGPPAFFAASGPRAPLHGMSLLPSVPALYRPNAAKDTGRSRATSSRRIICESGTTRSLMTDDFRYVYSPGEVSSRKEGKGAVERLYDIRCTSASNLADSIRVKWQTQTD